MFPTILTRISAAACLLVIILTSSAPVQAQRVEPMRYELAPSGSRAQTTLMVTNTRSFPITVEAVVNALELDAQGAEALTDAEDHFLIFPQQTVIAPGEAQAFRVRYIGTPDLDRSQAYRIGINQLPIDMREEGETGVAVVTNFATLANVVPAGSRSKLAVERTAIDPDGRWRLWVRNHGTKFARLSEQEILVEQGTSRAHFRVGEEEGRFSKNLVLPGHSLETTMPAIEGFDPAQSTITLVQAS